MNPIDELEARSEAIEAKQEEIQTALMNGKEYTAHDGVKTDLVDWFANFESERDTLSEFLNESIANGNGRYLRDKMTASLEAYCEQLAIDEIDNARG